MALLIPSVKSSFEDLFWTWFEIITKGPEKFFIALETNENSKIRVYNEDYERATPFEFFIFMFVVCVILLHYYYAINQKFISDDVAVKLSISKDYVGVVAVQTFTAFFLLGIQCLIYTLIANWRFVGGKVTLQKIVLTKFYLFAYAVIPYLTNVILSWAIAKTVGQIENPTDDQLESWIFVRIGTTILLWIIMVAIDVIAIATVSKAKTLKLFAVYLPISFLLLGMLVLVGLH